MQYIVITKTQHLCFIEKEKLRNLNYLCFSWNEVGQYLLFSWIIRKIWFPDIGVHVFRRHPGPDRQWDSGSGLLHTDYEGECHAPQSKLSCCANSAIHVAQSALFFALRNLQFTLRKQHWGLTTHVNCIIRFAGEARSRDSNPGPAELPSLAWRWSAQQSGRKPEQLELGQN